MIPAFARFVKAAAPRQRSSHGTVLIETADQASGGRDRGFGASRWGRRGNELVFTASETWNARLTTPGSCWAQEKQAHRQAHEQPIGHVWLLSAAAFAAEPESMPVAGPGDRSALACAGTTAASMASTVSRTAVTRPKRATACWIGARGRSPSRCALTSAQPGLATRPFPLAPCPRA